MQSLLYCLYWLLSKPLGSVCLILHPHTLALRLDVTDIYVGAGDLVQFLMLLQQAFNPLSIPSVLVTTLVK